MLEAKAALEQGSSSPILSLGKLAMSRILHEGAHVQRLLLGAESPRALALSGAVPERWLGGSAQLACALAGPQPDPALSPAAQLALAGGAR